ncbi:MAG: ThiF family adenylyltransferase [Bdellovibrionaceae bacterium]|nr:ThiF family adenylyltransferase [Pseudobdellovibrionaceae bacterium]MBX3033292.1 ThiF family adenylyltransferase [Pseudobdellovibrionaceae bacterium]
MKSPHPKNTEVIGMKPDYKERYLRSIGILTESQLATFKNTTVAVAGLGLGGSIFINLARMGFEKFHIADPDIYERTNINRQRLAKETTIGRRKDDCLIEEAKAVNPDVQIKVFRDGVKPANVESFLTGVDWVVDVVDLFALPDKLALNAEARRRGLPVVSCATLGFTGCMVVFDPKTPSFAELTGMTPEAPLPQNLERFFRFIAPEVPSYMLEQVVKSLDRSTYIPFITPGGEISAAFAASEIAKNILGLGRRVRAPEGIFVDPVQQQVRVFEASYRARELPMPLPARKAA